MTDKDTVEGYHQALEQNPGDTSAIDQGVATFQQTFADLTREDLARRIGELYADEFYFNDTVHIARERSELVDYMARTGQTLEQNRVEVHKVIRDGSDVYVRWEMTFVTRAMGKRVESHSIGMTHLRFDKNGQIVLHQDFWDSGSALYAHLPVVGFFVRRAQGAMQ
ncbi:nuclear transport factor 2 family protein [Wenzhouxiangella sp. EGI_FJ10305]|uniref:nuclear transport factor 2 family protein n=1 Tax=Wenzhouxiangella sp. EGI_FJ10305 TaxID=3243768 RepID=UPI0035D99A21